MAVNVQDITAGGITTIPYDTFFTATIKNFSTRLEKNFLEYRPVVKVLMNEYGETDSSGGRLYQTSAEFGYNSTTKWFSGVETFDTTPAQTALPLIYQWTYLGSTVSVSKVETLENAGKAQIFNITESRIKQAMRTMTTTLGAALYGDGSGTGNLSPIGLAGIVSTTPTVDLTPRAIGGMSATQTWWRNNAVTSFGSWAANGIKGTSQDLVFDQWNRCTDGMEDVPNVILTDRLTFQYYNQTLLSTLRYVDISNKKMGDASFSGLEYQGKPMVWDRQCPTGFMYLLNTNYIKVVTDPRYRFEWTQPLQFPDQMAFTRIVGIRLVVICRARMFHSVMSGITA